MHKYSSGHRTQIFAQLAAVFVAAVLFASVVFYVVTYPGSSSVVLALVLSALVLFSLAWMYIRMGRQKNEHLRYHALHDSLTDLPNRSLFVDRVDQALTRADENSASIAIMFVDLDNFKDINHSYGYETGDKLLVAVAERLTQAFPSDTLGRLGGDEFTVLLEDVSDINSAVGAADRLNEQFEAPFTLAEGEMLLSASVGITLSSSSDISTPESLLREANVAMQGAKKKGKSRYTVFDPGAESTTGGRLVQESEMRRAIKDKEFRVYYQPLVSLETGTITGVEALVRWQHPLYGLIPPSELIPLAEQTGLITPIGRWVLKESCRHVRAWQEEHRSDSPLTLNVTVSACQFQQPNLVKEVRNTLRETGLAPHDLNLEITESVMMHDASAISALKELKGMGIRLAMDDFGTGYSSLSYLKRFPIDTLKIDRSYINGLGSDGGDTAIVHATIAFAKSLNPTVTAEGIENAEQLTLLSDLGCGAGQGYYFARPLPGHEAAKLLTSGLGRLPRDKHLNQG